MRVPKRVSATKRRQPLFAFDPVGFAPAVWAALLVLTSEVNAEVRENLRYQPYSVSWLPTQSLLQALDAASPIRHDGAIYHGFTQWQIDWRFHWWQAPNGACRITSVTTTLDIVILLPQLQQAVARDSSAFSAYVSALHQHEQGHADTGRLAAKAIDQAIAALPQQASCAELDAAANQTGHRLIAAFRQRDTQYDLATKYGRTQGAYLPRAER